MGRLAKITRRGFTLIEVSLFLAITGLLFLGVTAGVQNSIFQQRYNDSVQSFVEYLRSVYAGVANVQSLGQGRSGQAIYGKLVTFGESQDMGELQDMVGETINTGDPEGEVMVFAYDVIGEIGDVETNNVLDALKALKANVVVLQNGKAEPVGVVDEFRPRWGARIENTDNYGLFKGALLIVRHPKSGTIYTYVTNETINVNQKIAQMNLLMGEGGDDTAKQNVINSSNILNDYWNKFQIRQADFCVNPAGDGYQLRADVRILRNARNASSIEMIMDGDNNVCREI